MTTIVSKGYTWIAARDGEAHAHPFRGRPTRTLCDRPAVDPRFAWPASTRCTDCTAVVDGTKAAG